MSVDYHRHCQATVLGATGDPFGNGKTWHKITQLVDQLTQLDENWLSNFTNNVDVTEDLAGILKLIDNVAGKVNALNNVGYTLKFKNDHGIVLAQKELNKGGVTEFVLGRDVTLRVGGTNYKFNTMKKGNDEQDIIDIAIPTQSTSGDLIDITSSGRVDVRNNISTGYSGVVGITSGNTQNRRLKECQIRVENTDPDGEIIAYLVVGDERIPIRANIQQSPEPEPEQEPRYVITEDREWDIVLSGGNNDWEPLDYTDGPELDPRYVVTENGHEYDIGVSGYGDSVLLNYNED